MHCSQSRGVTVAQVILVHFVEVRILTGLPFFCLFSGGLGKNGRESFRKELVSGLAKRNFRRHSNYQQSPSARRPKRRTCPTCPTGPTQAPPQRRLRANDAIQSLYCLHISQGSFATVTTNKALLRGAPSVGHVRLVRQVRHKRRPNDACAPTMPSRACIACTFHKAHSPQ